MNQKYDRILLIVAALLLLASGAGLLAACGELSKSFFSPSPSGSGKLADLSKEFAAIETTTRKLRQPAVWNAAAAPLLVSRIYFEKNGALVDPLSPDSAPFYPPVPNDWISKFELPFGQPGLLEQDPDDDGFTTLMEWENHTSPVDATSHPPYTLMLSLQGLNKKSFFLTFSSRPSPGIFALDSPDRKVPTQFLELNQQVVGTNFVLTKFDEKKITTDNGVDRDISELTLEDSESKQVVVLTLGVRKDTPDITAVLLYRWKGEKVFLKKKDDTFTLLPDESVIYKIIDIQENEVQIEASASGERFAVKRSN